MKFNVNCADSIGVFAHFWEGMGFTPAKLLLRADMRQQLDWIGGIGQHGIRYVRAHYLLDLVLVDVDAKGEIHFDWHVLDRAMTPIVENGLKPIFELMGNPGGLYNGFHTQEQVTLWKELVSALAVHLIEHYGVEEVRTWLFETWNEPDIPGAWFSGSAEDFCHHYDACAEGLWSVEPALILGGPGSCRTLSPLFKVFAAHCDDGVNYFTGKHGTRLDFISVHEKGARNDLEDLTPNTQGIIEREQQAVEYLREQHPRLAGVPFFNDECDPQVGWWDTHTWRGKSYYAAIAAKIIHQHQTRLMDQLDVSYGLLSNDNGFLGRWGQRTLLARFTTGGDEKAAQAEFQAEATRYRFDLTDEPFEMIKQPIFNVMSALALLGNEQLAVKPDLTNEGIGLFATRTGEGQIVLLAFNSNDEIMSSGEELVTVRLSGLTLRDPMLVEYRIDPRHGNPFGVWEKMNAPKHPGLAVLEAMEAEQELTRLGDPLPMVLGSDDEGVELRTDLPVGGVHMWVVSEKPERPPRAPEWMRLTPYPGMTELENVMLRWEETGCRTVLRYEVLASERADGTFRRVNRVDSRDCAFLHRRPPGTRWSYRVRVVDQWGRTAESAVYEG
ncbi:MAG: hypothetical protein JW750_10815 [Anaerolineaceae bacterium]|nr:hypothetical protein [Anaerolineaceae bacterium]